MARSYTKSEHSMQGAFIFVLLGLFALMSTLMVLLGAQMYRATVDHTQHTNEERLLSAYVRSMVRAQDSSSTIDIKDENGTPVLCLVEDDDEGMAVYATHIYVYDGKLYELYERYDDAFQPERGTPICDAHGLSASVDGSLLTVKLTDVNDVSSEVRVALHCVKGTDQ